MQFLKSKLLILVGLNVLSDRSLNWRWVLFQLLMTPKVIEFFPYESVLLDVLNTLSAVDETVCEDQSRRCTNF